MVLYLCCLSLHLSFSVFLIFQPALLVHFLLLYYSATGLALTFLRLRVRILDPIGFKPATDVHSANTQYRRHPDLPLDLLVYFVQYRTSSDWPLDSS